MQTAVEIATAARQAKIASTTAAISNLIESISELPIACSGGLIAVGGLRIGVCVVIVFTGMPL